MLITIMIMLIIMMIDLYFNMIKDILNHQERNDLLKHTALIILDIK
jgi:GGDEF domain-containing protein